jgi:predicted DNA-binding protein with PD1-like motif
MLRALKAGSTIPEGILEIARSKSIRTASVAGIGGVNTLTIAYFNRAKRKYEEHHYVGFMEVTSLLGNITLKDGRPFLHAHGTFGRKDMSVIGGHIIRAAVFPTLEIVITPIARKALRRFDERLGLNLIYRS